MASQKEEEETDDTVVNLPSLPPLQRSVSPTVTKRRPSVTIDPACVLTDVPIASCGRCERPIRTDLYRLSPRALQTMQAAVPALAKKRKSAVWVRYRCPYCFEWQADTLEGALYVPSPKSSTN
jgi:hypothetical protein